MTRSVARVRTGLAQLADWPIQEFKAGSDPYVEAHRRIRGHASRVVLAGLPRIPAQDQEAGGKQHDRHPKRS